ncbi:hypothetical protein B0H14DRAFT_3101119 [Mycena olivaceomarginata]|nr:hypothetical protein B0H14DRAFT_3101119 [Mycena olivaceomarginata]
MLALGLNDLPSDRVMDDIDKVLQPLCGIQTIRYAGKLGHVYYVNDFAAIIAQEMANPSLDSDLTTPMIREHGQDFFIHEPTMLQDGNVCIPFRWFQREGEIWARVWKVAAVQGELGLGWVVETGQHFHVKSTDLSLSFPHLASTHTQRNLPDPRVIYGIKDGRGELRAWEHTAAAEGNSWRKKASGHRVLSFPVWLYCDDTSGNMSKKWNKHNSFLFTAAGLPRQHVHQESNIHFLSTSNIAPPLEMLDGNC